MIASLLLLSSVDWDFSQAAAFTCRTLRPLRSRMASKFVVFLPRISLALGRGAGNVTCHGITRSREAAPYEACQFLPPACWIRQSPLIFYAKTIGLPTRLTSLLPRHLPSASGAMIRNLPYLTETTMLAYGWALGAAREVSSHRGSHIRVPWHQTQGACF